MVGWNRTSKQPVAIKFETCDAQVPQLRMEYDIYRTLEGIGRSKHTHTHYLSS